MLNLKHDDIVQHEISNKRAVQGTVAAGGSAVHVELSFMPQSEGALHAQKYAGWEDGHSIKSMLPSDIKHHISLKVQLLRCLVCSDLVSIKPERDLCFGRYSFACLFAACKLIDCRPHWLTWAQFELLSPLVLQLTAVKAPM